MTEAGQTKTKARTAGATKTAGGAKPSCRTAVTPREKPTTKIDTVIGLLKRKEGATLEEMVSATGWLPHTTRAALTGLRKKNFTIERDERGDATCYRMTRSA